MLFRIDQAIFDQHPDLKIGAVVIKGFDNSRRSSAIESLLRGVCAQRYKEFSEKDLNDEPKLRVWDQAYGKFGINPKKNLPSIAALLKRVQNGDTLPHINPLVDLYNYFSLKYMLPVGGEDLDWLCGDLRLTFTKGQEPFRKMGSIEVEKVKEGEVAYIDDGGITCRYWNHRECERTKFTSKTVNAVILFEDLSNTHMDAFGEMLNEIQEAVAKYIGGQIKTYILTEESSEIDFGIEGRRSADDSKIPDQEKQHFLEVQRKQQQTLAEKVEGPKPKKKQSSSAKPPQKRTLKKAGPLNLKDQSFYMEKLRKLVLNATEKLFESEENKDAPKDVQIEYPRDPSHGDYASNIAMHLTKTLHRPPREIAEEIVKNIEPNNIIGETEVAGPGFINIFLSKEILEDEIAIINKEGIGYAKLKTGRKRPIIIEYSAPNIAKPLGVHHLLSTIVGQSLYNIFDTLGFKSISINHIGDWGTQFGKLIYAYKKWGDKATILKDPINELLKLYVKFHDQAEKDPKLEDKARYEFKIFEEGNSQNRKLWQWFVDESMKEITATYKKIGGIKFDHTMGESFYEDKLEDILEEGKKKKVFTEGEQGAQIIEFDDPNMSTLVVQKKDGATLYATRDLATMKYRIKRWKPVKVLYVVDIAQTLYFKQLFAAEERFSWYNGEGEHVWFGRMHMKDGKMSTRKGNVILLNDLLDEAIKRAQKVIEEKSPELKKKEEVARVVGTGALKYNILSQNRTTDIIFDWDRMLSFEGNSAPYLQYSYARAKSILKKAEKQKTIQTTLLDNLEEEHQKKDPEEKTVRLVRTLIKFKEYIAQSAQEYKPNILCNYLYELAQNFNAFYNSVPVLKSQDKETLQKRLEIVEAFSHVLKGGLSLVGVEVVEEM